MGRRHIAYPLVGIVGVALIGALLLKGGGDAAQGDLTLRMENAAALQEGSPAYVNGQRAGSVRSIAVEGGAAEVGLDLDGRTLHEGGQAWVRWQAVLGQRVVWITDGKGAEMEAGATMQVREEQVDVNDVLTALDAPTRQRLQSLLGGLDSTLTPVKQPLNGMLGTSGPALQAIGQIVEAVGQDGRSIRDLVTQLNAVMAPLALKNDSLTQSVTDLTDFADTVAAQESALSEGLRQLPETLDAADATFEAVGPAAAQARPLLRDLRPVSERLTSVSRKLAPVLVDLRPAIARLRPVLGHVDEVLDVTPSLLDNSAAVMPGMTATVDGLVPAIDFLRPYTPDAVGWLSNWGSAFSYYDAQGHYASAVVRMGAQAFDDNPGVQLPGVTMDPAPAPGIAGGTPWTDANGSPMR
jgi:phospholipid/cholesterol/gamma-HCH transport system substrate-binding protein